ncbi:hypothetical protein VNI00_019258 [Paramarasmius palmivorus]|uniref:Peptidase S28 n=1 Tax=Paramarasmius palmivorus TaxID=297713 RepID=A0AAW0APJ3_9AGAR
MIRVQWVLFYLLLWCTSFRVTVANNRPNANIMRRPRLPRRAVETSPGKPTDVNGNPIPPYKEEYWFNQLIDHQNPKMGTFKQRYYHTWEFHKSGRYTAFGSSIDINTERDTGGPIILSTPGESNAGDSWVDLTNSSIMGQFAQKFNGATIVLEHRFFGDSNPQPDLSEKSLKYLTIQQAMNDLVYFAKNVKLPMPGGDQVPPNKVPWILVGGSYAGALTAWTMAKNPGIFWAGYSSSGVVQPIINFWQYFEPIRQNMPQNCSADVERVISLIDEKFANGTQAEIKAIKTNFGLQALEYADDVASARPISRWQDLQPDPEYSNSTFFEFCDALEVKDGVQAASSGWGLQHAYDAMGLYFRKVYIKKMCGNADVKTCLNTHNTTSTDSSLDNWNRSWLWIVCNEVGWYQTGPPKGAPAIVSRLVSEEYNQVGDSATDRPRVLETTSAFHGWDIQVDRLFVANGRRDPWLAATLSAPSQNIASTDSRPIAISDGFHCSDMLTSNGIVDPTILDVQQKALASMKVWLPKFKVTDRTTTNLDIDKTNNSAL